MLTPVSVAGEFQRVLRDCVELLRACDEPRLERWIEDLDAAAREGREDLCAGAERALNVLGEVPGSRLAPELRRAEVVRCSEHLLAICRVILGR
jgi:hypothetical protein